jgi:hypothetical protein
MLTNTIPVAKIENANNYKGLLSLLFSSPRVNEAKYFQYLESIS